MGEDTHISERKKGAEKAITATFDLLEDLDLPRSLKDYGGSQKDIPVISEYILHRAEEMYSMSQYNPRKATLENLKEFFERVFEGRESINL